MPIVDVVLVPVGGGGLASGVATAVKALRPSTAVIGVEPELAADAQESLREGRLISWSAERTYRTAADGLRTPTSELTLAHLAARLDDIVTGNRRGPLPLRWVYLHMVSELAQHCGHADILREQILAARDNQA